jgi:hypothetical protein
VYFVQKVVGNIAFFKSPLQLSVYTVSNSKK